MMRKLIILSALALLSASATGCTCCDMCCGHSLFAKKAPAPVACCDPCAPAPVVQTAVPCCQ